MVKNPIHIHFSFCCCLFAICNFAFAQPVTQIYNYTGVPQTYTVPCTDTITVKAWGGGGSGGGADTYGGAVGGAGAFVQSSFVVIPGQVLTIIIGGGALPGGNHVTWVGGGSAGFGSGILDGGNGGNAGGSGTSGGGGGGGGGSGLYNGATPMIVAGGGGGGSGGGQFSSGATGGGGGVDGNPSPGSCNTPGLTGASPNAFGTVGANKGGGDGGGGGGGGGGLNGGTGGGVATGCDCGACGGGGGGNFSSGFNTTILNGNGQTPGNSADPDLPAGSSVGGGTSTAGGNGFIEIYYNPILPPTAIFSANTVCFNTPPTQFTNSSTGAISWNWDFGDPTSPNNTSTAQNPTHAYTASGSYTATLTVANAPGCTNTTTQTIVVNPTPVASITGNTTICTGSSTVLTASGGTNYLWNTTAVTTSISINPTTNTSYSVLVTDANGCSNVANSAVTVNPLPVISFSGTTTICFGNTTTLTASGGTNYLWNTNASTVSIIVSPTTTTTYSVGVTDANGCTAVASDAVTVNPLPVANFSANTPICINTPPMQFTDQSTGSAVSWAWDFGDPASPSNTSALQSPSHAYSVVGSYTATLTVANQFGCTNTITQTVTVNPAPVANFTAPNVCFNNPSVFTDQSTGNPVQWAWDFGDSNTAGTQSPSHTYNTYGPFTVTLAVANSFGCVDTMTKNIFVNPLPLAGFESTTVCIGNTTVFTDTSIILLGNIAGWSWIFGDPASGANNNSTIQNPSHLFTSAGNYNVVLTVTSDSGCQSNTNLVATVLPPPVAAFTAPTVCMNNATQFTDGSSADVTQWFWQFGDGGTSLVQNPSHPYLSWGNYLTTLIVTSGGGCKDTVSGSVRVNASPTANFISDTVCNGKTTTLSDLSYIPNGNIVSWSWNFGDGNTSALENPTNVYASGGTFSVTLMVTSDSGCTGAVSIPIEVYPLPHVNFSTTPGPVVSITDDVAFHDLSTGGAVSWAWNFGDSAISNLQNPTHVYSDTGTYNITLVVVTQYGCIDSTHQTIETQDYTFYMPSAFTPNGDAKNEFFYGKGIGITEYEMWIFDNWGNSIFYCETEGLPQSSVCQWDGTVKGGSGAIVPEGVYVWKVHLTNIFGQTYNFVGTLTVIK